VPATRYFFVLSISWTADAKVIWLLLAVCLLPSGLIVPVCVLPLPLPPPPSQLPGWAETDRERGNLFATPCRLCVSAFRGMTPSDEFRTETG
jgi:hypothetical protein